MPPLFRKSKRKIIPRSLVLEHLKDKKNPYELHQHINTPPRRYRNHFYRHWKEVYPFFGKIQALTYYLSLVYTVGDIAEIRQVSVNTVKDALFTCHKKTKKNNPDYRENYKRIKKQYFKKFNEAYSHEGKPIFGKVQSLIYFLSYAYTIEEIAEIRNTSVNNIRATLKNCYKKLKYQK